MFWENFKLYYKSIDTKSELVVALDSSRYSSEIENVTNQLL